MGRKDEEEAACDTFSSCSTDLLTTSSAVVPCVDLEIREQRILHTTAASTESVHCASV